MEYLPIILIMFISAPFFFCMYMAITTAPENESKTNEIEDKIITILENNNNTIELNETEEYINIKIKK